MKHLRIALLASAAIGLATLVSATAAPVGSTPAVTESSTQNARVVCDQWGRCYNSRRYRAHRYRNYDNGYYGQRNYGFYGQRRSYGFGPFGLF